MAGAHEVCNALYQVVFDEAEIGGASRDVQGVDSQRPNGGRPGRRGPNTGAGRRGVVSFGVAVGRAVLIEEGVDDLEDGLPVVRRQGLKALEATPDADVDLDGL